jgi:predicted RNase H-like HicB family nuclease
MPTEIAIKAQLEWKYARTKSNKYIAICPALKQTLQANSFGEMLEVIKEALDSTFQALLETGDLQRFLREHGWSSSGQLSEKTKQCRRFEVPFDLNQVRERDLEATLYS